MKLVVVLTIFSFLIFSCTTKNPDLGFCTNEYRQLKVFVQKNGQPAQLDSAYVIKNSNGQRIVNPPLILQPGYYTVLSDGSHHLTPDSFTIHGYLSGAKVLQEAYYIDHDECHIIGVSGKDTVSIQWDRDLEILENFESFN